ncbi:MAG: PAS domain-containing sensor histidine kinase [Inquilinus sp.]|nr:PAS domain-containing sensor histidine kinase [Inquilinus sp.]
MLRQIAIWAARAGLANKFAVVLTVAALASGVATYGALTAQSSALGRDANTVNLLLNLDLFILLLLGLVIARRIALLWVQRRRGIAGSRLHARLVLLFSVLAVAPAIIVAAFSALVFYLGVQSWFSERVSTAINESLSVAQAYLQEHQQTLRADALSMANDLNRELPRLIADPAFFNQMVSTQSILRGLSEALVFDGSGRTLARSNLTFALQFEQISDDLMERARNGDVVLLTNEDDDRVRALIALDRFVDTYLLIGRLVEPQVIGHMVRSQGAVAEYQQLESRRSTIQITFTLIYAVVALLLMLVAVWIGLVFADTLVTPIGALIVAAERVRDGDLTARVDTPPKGDELGKLARAFNRMTSQLESQQRELIEANRQLDLRRRFTETVLSGVSAGVLGLDEETRINLPNRSATELLGLSVEVLAGKPLVEVVPEMAELLEKSRQRPSRLVEGQVIIQRDAERRTLLVRIAPERLQGEVRGYVVTFDDISELLSAQRKAAWADIARRIAHEMKNPLTPIQLSAERLKRKYLKQIDTDPETFITCTDTIVRQVDDIGRMVDEFSAFARMPSPVMKPEDVANICEQAVFLQRSAHPRIEFTLTLPEDRPMVRCDGRQVSQALTNLLQNAVDAIEGTGKGRGRAAKGHVDIALTAGDGLAIVTVEDDGPGLPQADRERLTEPYVTTRSKGTGLGLAIVKKIMEDHGGRLVLTDCPDRGARVQLVFPSPDKAVAAPAGRRPQNAKTKKTAAGD